MYKLCPLKAKFENLVCKISQKVFELEPSFRILIGYTSIKHESVITVGPKNYQRPSICVWVYCVCFNNFLSKNN